MRIPSPIKISKQVESYMKKNRVNYCHGPEYEALTKEQYRLSKKWDVIREWCEENKGYHTCICKTHPDYNSLDKLSQPVRFELECIYEAEQMVNDSLRYKYFKMLDIMVKAKNAYRIKKLEERLSRFDYSR